MPSIFVYNKEKPEADRKKISRYESAKKRKILSAIPVPYSSTSLFPEDQESIPLNDRSYTLKDSGTAELVIANNTLSNMEQNYIEEINNIRKERDDAREKMRVLEVSFLSTTRLFSLQQLAHAQVFFD